MSSTLPHDAASTPAAPPATQTLSKGDQQRAARAAARLLKNASNHGAWVYGLAHAWGIPTIIAISFGAFAILAGASVHALWVHGADFVEWGKLASTLVLLFAGDLAFAAALLRAQNAHERGAAWYTLPLDYAVIAVVGAMETWTYWLLLTGEGSATAIVASGPMNGLRAASGILAAAYLTTLRKPQPTDKDFVRVAGRRASEKALTKLEQIPIDETSMGKLYEVGATANDHTLSERERATKLVQTFEELAPGSLKQFYEAQIDMLRQRMAQIDVQTREQLDTMRRQLEEAVIERARAERDADESIHAAESRADMLAAQRAIDTLLQTLTTQQLPNWVLDLRPDLAGVDVGMLLGGSRKTGPHQIADMRPPKTQADRQRKCLRGGGVTDILSAPDGRNGVWVSASNIVQLSGGKVDNDAARIRIKRLEPTGLKSRGQLVARFQFVMEDLARAGLLSSAAQSAYDTYRTSAESGDEEVDGGEAEEPQEIRARA